MSDPADEGQQVNNVCAPPGRTVYKKYACYQKSGTSDWFTHTCHPDAVAFIVGSCTQTVPAVPPFIPAQYQPTPRPDHAKDYTTGDGRKRFFIASGATQPSGKIYVDRND